MLDVPWRTLPVPIIMSVPDTVRRGADDMADLKKGARITGALVGVQPFGGFNLSGSNAKAGGPDYLRLFMEMKTVAERF